VKAAAFGAASACGFLLAGLGFVFLYDALTQAPHFAIRSVEVGGLERLGREEILEAGGIRPGHNLLALNLESVRNRLLSHPWVEDARVRREIPSVLAIHVEEHRPAALLELDRPYLINSRGEIFKEAAPGEAEGLPRVSGLTYRDIETALPGRPEKERRHPPSPAHRALAEILHLGMDPPPGLPPGWIRRIRVDRELGLELTAFEPEMTVRLGYRDYERKVRVLSAIRSYVRQLPVPLELLSVDLANPERAVVVPASGTAPAGNRQEV